MIFRRRPPLPPLTGELRDYWVTVHVKFATPVYDVDDPLEPPVQGYYRNFGVRCTPNELDLQIDSVVDDGVIDWPETEWYEVDAASLDTAVRKQIALTGPAGVWYRSGRILYQDPDLEEDAN